MKIVFMGTPDFAQTILRSLVEQSQEVIAVYTQPDRPKGRSGEVAMPPVKEYALEKSIPVYQPVRIRHKKWVELLKEQAPDLIIVAAFGQILPPSILEIAPYINVHASLLPKYRGSSPIQHAIAEEETVTGVTIMRMDEGMDTGAILLQEEIAIDPRETGASLFDKLSSVGVHALSCVLQKAAEGDPLAGTPQNPEEATSAPLLTRESGKIDWTQTAHRIDCRIRAFTPWPGAYSGWNGKMLKILAAHEFLPETEEQKTEVLRLQSELTSGTVLTKEQVSRFGKKGSTTILVLTGKGLLQIDQCQLSGKRAMDAKEFLCGNPIFGKKLDYAE